MTEAEHSRLAKLRVKNLDKKPVEWVSRKYRRLELCGDEAATRKAESAERAKWATKIFQILADAKLPMGIELEDELDGPLAGRCLRGLRANSLRKRVSDVRPYLRWLQADRGKRFPSAPADVLNYFHIRSQEGAARTVYSALLSSLKFFEEAGEVDKEARIPGKIAIENDVKEYEARNKREMEEAGIAVGRKPRSGGGLAIKNRIAESPGAIC